MVVKEDVVERHIGYQKVKNQNIVLGIRQNDARDIFFNLYKDINSMPNPWKLLHSHNFSVSKYFYNSVGGFSNDFISRSIIGSNASDSNEGFRG